MAGAMLARSRECMRRPHHLTKAATITEAVATLDARRVDSLLVDGENGVGMVTKTDLLNALVLEKWPQDAPVRSIANFSLITVRPDQYLFEALVAMTRHRVERVVVMEDDVPVGVVELTDALSHFSSRSHVVSLQVEQADDLASLSAASRLMPDLVRGLMAQGAKPRFVMGLLSALNGRIIGKTWDFLVDERYHGATCLMVMGSEGRGEQILKTDQDNGLILEENLAWPEREAVCVPSAMRFSNWAIRPVRATSWCPTRNGWRGDAMARAYRYLGTALRCGLADESGHPARCPGHGGQSGVAGALARVSL